MLNARQRKTPLDGKYMGLGIAFGAAFGVAFDNVAIGVALGVVLGAVIGVVKARRTVNSGINVPPTLDAENQKYKPE